MPALTSERCAAIRAYDTCKIANAIEHLGLRLRNEGYSSPGLQQRSGACRSALGYAVTSRVRSADPPVRGAAWQDLRQWWSVIERSPSPRLAIVEDVDAQPGQGTVLSDLHAEVLRALGCDGLVTNGAVRNLPALRRMRFPVFSRFLAVSHAYIHTVEQDLPVDILGLPVNPGDLIYADCHGAISIPEPHLDDILHWAAELASSERRVIDFCRSANFSLSGLFQVERNR